MWFWKHIAENGWWEKKLKKTEIDFEKFKGQEEKYEKHYKVISGLKEALTRLKPIDIKTWCLATSKMYGPLAPWGLKCDGCRGQSFREIVVENEQEVVVALLPYEILGPDDIFDYEFNGTYLITETRRRYEYEVLLHRWVFLKGRDGRYYGYMSWCQ